MALKFSFKVVRFYALDVLHYVFIERCFGIFFLKKYFLPEVWLLYSMWCFLPLFNLIYSWKCVIKCEMCNKMWKCIIKVNLHKGSGVFCFALVYCHCCFSLCDKLWLNDFSGLLHKLFTLLLELNLTHLYM